VAAFVVDIPKAFTTNTTMNYPRDHLEMAHRAGKRNMALDDLLAVIGISPESEVKTPGRRGRPAKATKSAKAPVSKKTNRGKRGAIGQAIKAFLAGKGKTGAHVKDIAAATKNKPANVTAFFYAPGNKKAFKKVAPATFAHAGKE
jgi:hypothetical protein